MSTLTIFKHFHFSNFIPKILRLIKIKEYSILYNVEFTESCRYNINEKSCVNKLFGFSYGLFGVHRNSVRFGWTYNEITDNIEIWKYIYKNRKLTKKILSNISIGDIGSFKINIERKNNKFINTLYINNQPICIEEFAVKNIFLLTLGFYFGGKTRAPHKMQIIIS